MGDQAALHARSKTDVATAADNAVEEATPSPLAAATVVAAGTAV
jgi:hypothetical protein